LLPVEKGRANCLPQGNGLARVEEVTSSENQEEALSPRLGSWMGEQGLMWRLSPSLGFSAAIKLTERR